MKSFIAVCLLAVACADQKASDLARQQGGAGGRPQQGGGRPAYSVSPGGFKTPLGSAEYDAEEYHYRPSPYAFDYAVRNAETGAEYAANESHDGTQTTGFYTVALPDGRIQTVKYTVDETGGFNAEVSYEGEARFPDPSEYQLQARQQSGGQAAGYKQAKAYRSGPVYRSTPVKAATYEE